MKIKTLSTIIVGLMTTLSSCASTDHGWGKNQGNNTITGGVIGATTGGVIGHQFGKQKEGIIIGTILGGITGNQIGKGKDAEEANKQAIARHQQFKYEQATRDAELEMAKARAEELEKRVARERQLRDLRDRQARAEQELKELRK